MTLPSGNGPTDAAHSLSVVFATDATAPPTGSPAGSTDAGQNVALTVANTVVQAASAAAPGGMVAISADPGNTVQVHVGRASGVTAGAAGKGIRLAAGQTVILPAANANEFFLVAATATQNVGVLAL